MVALPTTVITDSLFRPADDFDRFRLQRCFGDECLGVDVLDRLF